MATSARAAVPEQLEAALDPAWLGPVLAPVLGGRRVVAVELVELIRTVASKARVAVTIEGVPIPYRLCLKAFLDLPDPATGGSTTIREADFYTDIAPQLTMRVPACPAVAIDREQRRGILVMDDLTAAGARFCTAVEPFEPAFVERTLDQLARLHAAARLVDEISWLPARLDEIVAHPHLTREPLQRLLDDGRGPALDDRTRDAGLLLGAMERLAERVRAIPATLLHGDCHAGNVYIVDGEPGFTDWQLVQKGAWALDVAYHINAVLPVDVAAREERRLLAHYIAALARHGGATLDEAEAWDAYRACVPYGFYHWAITQFTPRPIIDAATERLGAAVMRHDSYALLGL